MLKQYTNIDTILESDLSLSAERFLPKEKSLFKESDDGIYSFPSLTAAHNPNIEFHVYSGDNWITGNHSIVINEYTKTIFDENDAPVMFNGIPVSIDIYEQFNQLKLTSGNYRFIINFFENKIGNYNTQHLVIDQISPDRTELRLRAIDTSNPDYLVEINNYINTVNQTSENTLSYKKYLLNFSRNQTSQFVNSVVIGKYLFVKLSNPLDDVIEENFKCWVVCERKLPFVDNVAITPAGVEIDYNIISGINWDASAVANTSNETALKSWNELLGSSVQTSQEIIDSYFSGSLSGVKLNIDYSDFNNFIFYSSATERLDNYKYKLSLLEYYTAQSASTSLLSGSVAVTNVSDYNTLKTNLIGGFDSFENYLYYESSSVLFTHNIPLVNANVEFVTGSYIQPSPKSSSTYPYQLMSISSSIFETWYNGLYDSASIYDNRNLNKLTKSIPEFILLDEDNEQLSLFINMLGHHYDILYTYINAMTKINTREEHPKIGMPNELLYSVAKQFGWTLTSGNQSKELWEYTLGTNESGIPLTGSNSVGDPSVPAKDITYTIWRRIVNNIPGLLKSKGTKRSIQALLSCYGVPQSLISINEYGGPRIERPPVYEKYNFDYALDLISNPAGTATVDYTQPIGGLELRFRTKDVLTHFTMSNTMNLYSVGSNNVTLDYVRGTLGTISINGTASANIDCLDGEWVNTLLRTNGSSLDIIAKKSSYGKILSTVSASAVASFPATGTVTLGGTSTGATRLEGQLQELRLWTGSLNDDPFSNHTKAPAAYDANSDAYTELVFRVPLTQKIDHSITGSLPGVQPKTSTISASFASWTNNTPYDSIEETYYYDGISLGAGTLDDNKIRIETNELVNNLNFETRASISQFDKAPLDSNKLGIYYSPQTMINEDIIAQLGFTKLDDLIGDPSDNIENKYQYPELIRTARNYWKKYTSKNDMAAYLKIFSLFDLSFFNQLDQLLPARVDKLTGLLIQPNILERSKDTALAKISYEEIKYNTSINVTPKYISGSDIQHIAIIKQYEIISLSGSDISQYKGIVSGSNNPYVGTIYSHQYQILSGSTWITSSTPSWESNAIITAVTGSRLSEFKEYIYSGSVRRPAQYQDYLPKGMDDSLYNGCKMTSPDFNINSTDTPDGKPVVEILTTNTNQIIIQPIGPQGNFKI